MSSSPTTLASSFLNPTIIITFLLTIVSLLLLLWYFRVFSSSSPSSIPLHSRKNILLLGSEMSGKTHLFYFLLHGIHCKTVKSMMENESNMGGIIDNKNLSASSTPTDFPFPPYHFIDFPSHPPLQTRLPSLFPSTRAILFIVNMQNPHQYPSSSTLLYRLLSNYSLCKSKVPMAIIFDFPDSDTDSDHGDNKSHIPSSLSSFSLSSLNSQIEKVQLLLEGTIDKSISYSSSSSEMEELGENKNQKIVKKSEENERFPLVKKGNIFTFNDSIMKVNILRSCIAKGKIEEITQFIKNLE